MKAAAWEPAAAEPEEPPVPGRPAPTFVSLHFLRTALLRRRWACLLSALAGLLAATAFLVLTPAPHTATAALVMAHDSQADPEIAMATDVSLATTRTVAQGTIDRLRLSTTPDDLLKDVKVEAKTSNFLTVQVRARTDAEAVRILTTFTKVFLDFRAKELSAQSDSLISGMNARIKQLKKLRDGESELIDELSAVGDTSSAQMAESLSRRAQISTEIGALQQSVVETTLKADSLVDGSQVVDAPAAVPDGSKRRIAFALASGLVAGTGLGVGLVLFMAITSDRLRRRADVALALEVPVAVSVGKLTPLPALPLLKSRNRRRAEDRRRLAHTIVSALPASGNGQWLTVACVDNADEVRFGVVEAAMLLQQRGVVVRLIDLTEKGNVSTAVQRLRPDGPSRPAVSRPRGIPSLGMEPGQIKTYGSETTQLPRLKETEVCLTVADLNPSVGAEHLTAWTQRVVVAVTAGVSSAERVTTVRDLIDEADLELWCGMLVRAEPRDHSSGSLLVPAEDG